MCSSDLHVLNMFLSWILSYQDLHMIAFLGLKISILFLCRVTYSILAHFYLVYLSLKSPTLISFQLCLWSSTSYLHRYSSYCGSVKSYLHRYSSYCGSIKSYLHRYSLYCSSVSTCNHCLINGNINLIYMNPLNLKSMNYLHAYLNGESWRL